MDPVIAVDAGGTWVKAAVFDAGGTFIREEKVASGASSGMKEYLASIATVIRQCGGDYKKRIGLSIPGVLSKDRRELLYMPNVNGSLPGDKPVILEDALSEILREEVYLVALNDADSAALGEWGSGFGKRNYDLDLLHLTWGTGIGTGFVRDGVVQYGWEGGHIPVDWIEGEGECGCGSRIDLESRASVPNIVRMAQKLFEENSFTTSFVDSDFSDPRETPKLLSIKAREDDELAQHVLREALRSMARGLHAMAVVAYPDVVTIGGAMMDSEWLLTVLREEVEREATGMLTTTLSPEKIERAALGNEAGLHGAYELVTMTSDE